MGNTIFDLTDILFDSMRAVNKKGISVDERKEATAAGQATSEIAKTIIEAAKLQVNFAKISKKTQAFPTQFFTKDPLSLEEKKE